MHKLWVIGLGLASGCSWVLVNGPPAKVEGMDPAKIECTESSVVPGIDSIAGGAAILGAGAGIVLEHTTTSGKWDNFQFYYAPALVALSIAYFWSASSGTDDVTACTDVKAKAGQPSLWQVQPIEPKRQADDIELPP